MGKSKYRLYKYLSLGLLEYAPSPQWFWQNFVKFGNFLLIRILLNSYSNNEYSLMTRKHSIFEFYSYSLVTLSSRQNITCTFFFIFYVPGAKVQAKSIYKRHSHASNSALRLLPAAGEYDSGTPKCWTRQVYTSYSDAMFRIHEEPLTAEKYSHLLSISILQAFAA